jgi:hypothetical protein
MRDTMRPGQPLSRVVSGRQQTRPPTHQSSVPAPNYLEPTMPSLQSSLSSANAIHAAQLAALKMGLIAPAPVATRKHLRPAIQTQRRMPITLRTIEDTPEKFMGAMESVCLNDEVNNIHGVNSELAQEGLHPQLREIPVSRVTKVKRVGADMWTEVQDLWGMGPPDFHPSLLTTYDKNQTTVIPETKRLDSIHDTTFGRLVKDIPAIPHITPATTQKADRSYSSITTRR